MSSQETFESGGEQLLAELRHIKRWARIQGLESLSRILEEFDDEELVMYDLANGERGMRDIAEEIPSSRSTVSSRMREWAELGIVEKDGRQWKHIAPLNAMGIERPELDTDGDGE